MEQRCLDLIRDLSSARSPSGFEDETIAVVRRYAEGIGRIEEDPMRNLYIYRREHSGTRPVLMLDAHSDEVGFMIHSIHPNGTLRFVTLGGWNKTGLAGSRVLVRNRQGEWIRGIIACKPPHFQTAAEKAAGGLPSDISAFIIDVGAASAEEAVNDFGIRIGEPVVPDTPFYYDEKHGLMFAKAFDCRIGAAVLLEVMRRLQGADLPIDVVATLSSQEEVGERGVAVSVNHVKPDIAVVMEGCPADDTFTESYAIQTRLKGGPMFRFMDVSAINNPRFMRWVLDLAEEKGLPAQSSVREGGGNNSAIIQKACGGIPAVVAGVPVRYIHAMNCVGSVFDFEASVRVVETIIRSLTPEIIRGF